MAFLRRKGYSTLSVRNFILSPEEEGSDEPVETSFPKVHHTGLFMSYYDDLKRGDGMKPFAVTLAGTCRTTTP
jgi:hypothetical protein